MDHLLFVAVILFCFGNWLLNGVRHDMTGAVSAGGVTSPLATIGWVIIYTAAFVRIYKDRTIVRVFARASLPLVLILALTCISTIWSEQPILTARRSIELLGTVAVAMYFASRLGLRGFTEALSLALTCAAGISFILAVTSHNVGRDPDTGTAAWSGLFDGKNFLGETMALAFVTAACLAGRLSGRWRTLQIAAIPLYFLLLVKSKAGAGAGAALVLAVFMLVMIVSRTKQSRTFALLGALALAGAVIVGLRSDDILTYFGKDATLTGRTMLWQLVVDAITQRPALGYGYAAFWGLNAPAAALVYPYINWLPGTAHNGFLEIALNCGIIGELIFFWLLALGLWRSFAMFWRGRDILSGWPLFAMLCIITKNVSDASLLAHGDADWIVFVAAFYFATEAESSSGFRQEGTSASQRVDISEQGTLSLR